MYNHILFDLDGTLTDPQVGIVTSVRYALEKEGFSPLLHSDLTWIIGPPLTQSFAQLSGSTDAQVLERLLLAYRERFGPIGLYENRVYEGIPELLKSLQDSGRQLFVATSKPTVYAERILQHFELKHFFSGIMGSELDGTRSDKGEVIRDALLTFGLDRRECIMVGDRKHDIVGAQANQLDSVGVLYGYGSEEELSLARPTHLARAVDNLFDLLVHRA